MIQINDEFRLKKDGIGFVIHRKKIRIHKGKVGTKDYKKLDNPEEYWDSIEKFPSSLKSAINIIKRIYINELAGEDRIYEIQELENYLKKKGL